MEAALADAADGRPGAVLIEGAAGSGKSRLAHEFSQLARRQGVTIIEGACVDLGQTSLPYAAVVDALRGLLNHAGAAALIDAAGPYAAELGALLPELGVARAADEGSAGGHARLLHAVLRVFAGMAVAAPLVVVIEDIHWADAATRDLIAYFVRTVRHARVLAVLTVRIDGVGRDHPLRELLGELRRDPVVRRATLTGLQRDEVAQQAAAILSFEPTAEFVDRLVERSDGNPFFVEELLATSPEGDNLPPTLRDVLLLHVDRLHESTRRVVDVAAVIGRRVDESLLAALVDIEPRQLDTALRDALEQHVLVVDEAADVYRFRHALLQEAVYAQLLVGQRRAVHGRIAGLLANHVAGGTEHAQILAETAHHLHRCGDAAAALHASIAAGSAAEEVFAFADAARQYERALDLFESLDADSRQGVSLVMLLQRAAEARWFGLGDAGGAADLLQRALSTLPATGERRTRAAIISRLAGFAWETGAAAHEGLARHEEALRLLENDDGPVKAVVLGRYARALLTSTRIAEAEHVARQTLDVATRCGAREDVATALVTLFTARGLQGDVPGAMEAIARARSLVGEVAGPDISARFFNNAGVVLYGFGRYEEAVRVADEGEEVLRRLGVSADDRMNISAVGAAALAALGRLDEAEVRLHAQRPRLPVAVVNVGTELANIARMRGDVDAARERLNLVVRAGAPAKDPQVAVPLHALRAEVEAWAGHHMQAWDIVQDGLRLIDEGVDALHAAGLLVVALRVQADLAAVDAGHNAEDITRALLRRLHDVVEPVGAAIPETRAWLAVGRAERSRLAGADARAWADAATLWDALRRPYDAAYARWRQAEALMATAAPSAEIRHVVGMGHADATRMGAQLLLSKLAVLPAADASEAQRSPDAAVPPQAVPPQTITLRKEGGFWSIAAARGVVRLHHTKGMGYLAQLIANPGVEIHAMELISDVGPSPAVARPDDAPIDTGSGVGPALDAHAKAAYRKRLDDLRADVEEAEAFNDPERAARARAEYDFLVAELSRAVGLGGRDRPVASAGERARVNVTKAIRAALRRIGEHDAVLAAQLTECIRTGTFCCYRPMVGSPTWQVMRGS